MTKNFTLLFLASVLTLAACRTATKAYDKGDYANAIELATKRLNKSPNDRSALDVLRTAYEKKMAAWEGQIRELSLRPSAASYEEIYRIYRKGEALTQPLRGKPWSNGLRLNDWASYADTYKGKAAATYFEQAEALMEEYNRQSYREAYNQYSHAERLGYHAENLPLQKQKALEEAQVHIVIRPIESRFGSGYPSYANSNGSQLQTFERNLINRIRQSSGTAFLQIHSDADARSGRFRPDEILELHLTRIDMGRPYDVQTSRQVSQRVLVKEIVHKPDSVTKEYATVYGTITTTERNLVSQGDLYVTARDLEGRVLWSDIYTGEHRWQTRFATYRGDERALATTDRDLLNGYAAQLPTGEQVSEAVLDRIASEATQRMQRQWQGYR